MRAVPTEPPKISAWGAIHPYLVLVVALAALLHIYQFAFVFADVPLLGVLALTIWALTPYVLCLIIASISVSRIPAAVGASGALFFDVAMHIDVITSKSSTAGIGFMFMPLWNLVLIAPFAMLMAWLAVRARSSNAAAP
jgi:FtsH-binding integral membrane protein